MPQDHRPVAVISGGSRGLGAALVAGCLTRGYRVATFSRQASDFTERTSLERQEGGDFHWEAVDLQENGSAAAVIDGVVRRFGRVDLLVNNAGIGIEGVLPLAREADILQAVHLNLTSALLLAQRCSRVMLRQNSGCIVNVSSVNGIRGHSGVAVYSATKAALDGFTRSLARELGPRNIRVNAVAPAYFESDMVMSLSSEQKARIGRRTPLGRLATIDDIVHAIHFLASPEASFITGHTLVVDGGLTC